MFANLDAANWRDYAEMNQWIVRASFPSLSMEFMNDWKERAALGRAFVFDRVVLGDRAAAMNGEMYLRTQRTAANAFSLPGSVNWWTTIRNNVIGFAMQSDSDDAASVNGVSTKPVITYISRQNWGRRKLLPEDHERLVAELYNLRDTYDYELNIVEMDKLSRSEQFRLAGRTTVSRLSQDLYRAFIQLSMSSDYAGCAWKRSDCAVVDASDAAINCDRVLLSWWLCARL